MKYGITLFPTHTSITPAACAAAAEARGFESFWVPEHSHMPESPMTPGPGGEGLPMMYYELVDPFVALAMAAQATERILLGTSICLVVQRDPIQLAKEVASLDHLSGGRFQFGVGGGWNAPEVAHHGTAWEDRLEVMRERLEVMKALWSQEKAEYHGKHVELSPSFAWPKPTQQPNPPIHVAANAPKGLSRVVRDGDAWFPMIAGDDPDGTVFDHIPALREKAAAAGKPHFEVSLYWCPADEALVKRCQDEGVDRVIWFVDPAPESAALKQLDQLVELRERCN